MLDADSVAALIYTADGLYLLQHREDLPQVTFPGMWGLFGGSRDSGERPRQALVRELSEELNFRPKSATAFLVSTFDTRVGACHKSRRRYYEILVDASTTSFTLGEGKALAFFSVGQLAELTPNIIPFDICALMMHAGHRGFRK